MTRRARLAAAGATVFLIACLPACGTKPRLFVNGQADMTFYRKVAVLPFANLSPDAYAGVRVTRAFVTELLIADHFQLVDPAELHFELDKIGADPDSRGNYDPDKLKGVAARLKVTGLIRGALTEYQMVRSGNEEVPTVAFDVEMVDAATGDVVWRTSVSRRGHGRFPLLGGPPAMTYSRLLQEACEEVVDRLRREVF